MTDGPMKLDERLALTVAEAAATIGVSKRHLQNWLAEIPHMYLGDRLLIPVKPFEAWIRDQVDSHRITSKQIANDMLKAIHSDTDKETP